MMLTGTALDIDPAGCALLKSVLTSPQSNPAPSSWRASAGFFASTVLLIAARRTQRLTGPHR